MKRIFVQIFFCMWYLLFANTTFAYTHADTLRGSNGRCRDWWDVQHYDLNVIFDTANKSIIGTNKISFKVIKTPIDSMQIDLQEPIILDEAIIFDSKDKISITKEDNVWWLRYPFHKLKVDSTYTIVLDYYGKPRIAKNPPWDGGFIWTHDSMGTPWIAVACQGVGASLWWPCKDAQWDEPDSGMTLTFHVPGNLMCISNGRNINVFTYPIIAKSAANHMDSSSMNTEKVAGKRWVWQVKNPINNYDATFYIGAYAHWHDTLMGEKGKLDLDFYALKYNEAKAKKQFAIVKPMIHCFEYWMGPYPFYEDGYKLVEAPYLGMEHQSAVAYGNQYKMGYLGKDRSNTGVGLKFDFIIVHESGHEWFGNSITAKDIADNWVHEGITTYTETLFAQCLLGKKEAFEYCRGEWANIRNDRSVIGDYGVNNEGSSDEYDKGAAVVHMIRMIINDDDSFRNLLHAISKTYYHKTVSSKELEHFISQCTGIDFTPLFNEYLRTTDIPELKYYIKRKKLYYHFNNIVPGFSLPIKATSPKGSVKLNVTAQWQHVRWKGGHNISFSKNFLIKIKI